MKDGKKGLGGVERRNGASSDFGRGKKVPSKLFRGVGERVGDRPPAQEGGEVAGGRDHYDRGEGGGAKEHALPQERAKKIKAKNKENKGADQAHL